MKKLIYLLVSLCIVSGLFCACNLSWKEKSDNGGDTSIKIVRFDKVVDDFVRTGNVSFSQRLSTDYPTETRILVENMLHLGSVADVHIYDELRVYFSDSNLVRLSADVRTRFASMARHEERLNKAYRRLKKELPELEKPYVYTQVSAFNQSIVVNDTVVGISLDKYMGYDYPLYAKSYTPVQRLTMHPDRIVPDLLSFYLMSQFPPHEKPKSLLHSMIQVGKIQWVVAQAMNTSVEHVSGFPAASVKWFQMNEQACWKILKENGRLYSADLNLFAAIVPLTAEKPYFKAEQSRGIGTWLGTQVVRNYMKKHPACTIHELLIEKSNEEVWQGSDYAS